MVIRKVQAAVMGAAVDISEEDLQPPLCQVCCHVSIEKDTAEVAVVLLEAEVPHVRRLCH